MVCELGPGRMSGALLIGRSYTSSSGDPSTTVQSPCRQPQLPGRWSVGRWAWPATRKEAWGGGSVPGGVPRLAGWVRPPLPVRRGVARPPCLPLLGSPGLDWVRGSWGAWGSSPGGPGRWCGGSKGCGGRERPPRAAAKPGQAPQTGRHRLSPAALSATAIQGLRDSDGRGDSGHPLRRWTRGD